MAIRRIFKKKFKGVTVKSGHIYKFKYQAWENDPEPLVIMLYALEGTHPNTGHQWRLFQAINFTYINRGHRKQFAKVWMKYLSQTNSPSLTWLLVKNRYPYLMSAVRRYFYRPAYYIRDLQEIPFDRMEKEVISTFARDFSKKAKTALLNKFRRVLRGRRKFIRTGKFPRRR